MIEMDTHERINLTGQWAGFGFQGGHMFTPEGHQLEPCDMTWWSLTCNIAREWRLMMEEARPRPTRSLTAGKRRVPMVSSVVYLGEYVRTRRERRMGVDDPGGGCGSGAWALPCPQPRPAKSCSGGRAWLRWREILAGTACGLDS